MALFAAKRSIFALFLEFICSRPCVIISFKRATSLFLRVSKLLKSGLKVANEVRLIPGTLEGA